MKIMIGVGHPKHVHFRKNIINNLLKDGHEVKIVARGKDITLHLLDAYGFNYEVVGTNYKSLLKKAYGLIESDIKVLRVAKRFKPDILAGGSPYLEHVSKLIGKPHIGFTDTEHATLTNWLSIPFSDVICTPSCYKGRIDPKKHVIYNGYEELAYLHPNYFKPDPSVLDELGLAKDEKFALVRFVSWNASHDIADKGFINKNKVIDSLKQYCELFISSESKLPEAYQKYKIDIPPEKIHDMMYYADLFIGESASMACESAVLGTPAIFVSTSRRGYTDELESCYDMLYNFSGTKKGQEDALMKASEILNNKNTKKIWQKKRDKLLKEKIDVTKFITEFIESYHMKVLDEKECKC
jgi:predicted glycosyltransferase